MAITYTRDTIAATLKLYYANYPQYANADVQQQLQRFYIDFGFVNAEPMYGDLAARDARLVTTAATLGLAALSPAVNTSGGGSNYAEREQDFWNKWLAKPPTAKP